MKCIKCNNEIGMNRAGLSFSGWTGKLGDGSHIRGVFCLWNDGYICYELEGDKK